MKVNLRPGRPRRIHLIAAAVVVGFFVPGVVSCLSSNLGASTVYLLAYLPLIILLSGLILAGALISVVIALIWRRRGRPLPAFVNACWGATGGLALSWALIFAPTWLAGYGVIVGSNFARFDPVSWRAPDATSWNDDTSARNKMLRHLVVGVLPGKSRDEVVALLGPSPETPYFAGVDKDLIYPLGPREGFFGNESEWLLIWFDDEGRFERYEVNNN